MVQVTHGQRCRCALRNTWNNFDLKKFDRVIFRTLKSIPYYEEALQFLAQVRQLRLSSLTVYDLRTINIVSVG